MQIVRILDLADRLEADIRARGLQPGASYLGTEETARLFRVGSALANRALQLLVKRGVLYRRQRLGTFIAKLPGQNLQGPLARVHLLVQREYMAGEGLLVDGVVVGMEGELPGTQIVFNFIPTEQGQKIVHRLVAEAFRSPEPEGFVLVRCPLEVQRLIESSGLPAVIHGQRYPSIRGIAWIDRDHAQAVELLFRHLLSRGCRRVVLLLRQQVLPGDHIMLDRIQTLWQAEGFGWGDVMIRCLSQDEACVAEEVGRILKAGTGQPTGFLCRSVPLADGVAAALARWGQKTPPVEIVVSDVYRKPGTVGPAYVHTRTMVSPEEIGHRIGRMLALQASGIRPEPDHEILPVELVEPG